jgi:hypothetical protein
MQSRCEQIRADVPDPEEIRRRLARGHPLSILLGKTATMAAADAAARALRTALPSDVDAFSSPDLGEGPTVTVLQLVTDSQAAAVRPALDALVAEFRQVAGALVGRMRAAGGDAGEDFPETVRFRRATWYLDPHGEHCRFENAATGEIVEVDMDDPDAIDAYFLLLYAQTSGRHGAVLDICVEGFHDMCRLLDLAGVTSGR